MQSLQQLSIGLAAKEGEVSYCSRGAQQRRAEFQATGDVQVL